MAALSSIQQPRVTLQCAVRQAERLAAVSFRGSWQTRRSFLEGEAPQLIMKRRLSSSIENKASQFKSTVIAAEEKEETIPLLTPYKLGPFELSHRIVYPPLTRSRALGTIPQPAAAEYYSQRATKGGFMIAEGTCICPEAHGYLNTPGVYTAEQVAAWRPIVAAVKAKGALFFCQIWHVGRASHPSFQPDGKLPIAPSAIPISDGEKVYTMNGPADFPTPRALDIEEIPEVVNQYRVAARNAREAGFDGVEIHGATGYLIDQFLKDGMNKRTDAYGGSVENRARFALEVTAAVIDEVGRERVGIRLAPFGGYLDASDTDPYATNTYLMEQLNKLQPLYVHLIEPRDDEGHMNDTTEPFRKAFNGTVIVAGGYKRENAINAIKSNHADLVAFGRLFLANPDLPRRFELNAPLNKYDRSTFYSPDQTVGYTDYPFLEDEPVVAAA